MQPQSFVFSVSFTVGDRADIYVESGESESIIEVKSDAVELSYTATPQGTISAAEPSDCGRWGARREQNNRSSRSVLLINSHF